jgi:hypothetical protein
VVKIAAPGDEVRRSESLFGAVYGVLVRMKCYRFNRDRSFAAKFCRLTQSPKKLSYMIGTGRSRLLDSCYFESQTWGAFHKAWKGYIIAKKKDEIDRLYYYAEVIQPCSLRYVYRLRNKLVILLKITILLRNLIAPCEVNKLMILLRNLIAPCEVNKFRC